MNNFLESEKEVSYKVSKIQNNKLKVEVSWNAQPCSGYKIRINDVEVRGKEIKIYYEKIYPEVDSLYCQVFRSPKDSYEVTVDEVREDYIITLIDS